jgi:hypothetical protein
MGWHWLDVVGAVATSAAAFLAWLAIRRSGKEAQASRDALVRERRIDFQLGILKEVAEVSQHWPKEARYTTLASLLPESLIPLTRAVLDLPAPEAARVRIQEVVDAANDAEPYLTIGRATAAADLVAEEVTQAILNLLEERDH